MNGHKPLCYDMTPSGIRHIKLHKPSPNALYTSLRQLQENKVASANTQFSSSLRQNRLSQMTAAERRLAYEQRQNERRRALRIKREQQSKLKIQRQRNFL